MILKMCWSCEECLDAELFLWERPYLSKALVVLGGRKSSQIAATAGDRQQILWDCSRVFSHSRRNI